MKQMLLALAAVAALWGCEGREAPPPYGAEDRDGKSERVTVKDPVCGMDVDRSKAKDHTYQGVKYYFCSQECHDKFENAPAQYHPPAR